MNIGHDHLVGFYDRDDDLVSAVADFFEEGLRRHERVVSVATPEHRAALERSLDRHGYAIADLAASGHYRALDARETLGQFMQAGSMDAAAFESQIGNVVASDGRPVRVFGEMVALLWDDGDVMSAIELEAMWNDLGRRRPFSLYCAYPMSAMENTGDLAAAKRVCDHHSHVVSMSAYPRGSPVETAADSGESRARMFVPTPPALRAVRRFVADVLCAWNADLLVDDASIVACELATNALRHAHSPFRICLSRSASVLRIAVRDASRDEPALLAPDPRRTGGRGIPLIAALSTAWGSVAETDGKTVWVELSI